MPSPEVLSALHDLHKELEKLEPAIKHVETAELVTRTVKDIPDKHHKLLEEIKVADKSHKQELKEQFRDQTNLLLQEVKRVIDTCDSIAANIRTQLDSIEKLRATIQSFYERIERINFPERLDKLDATVSGIMVAVQAIQGRLDLVERNLTDRIRDLSERYNESQKLVVQTIEKNSQDIKEFTFRLQKRRDIFTYITWFLVIAGTITLMLMRWV